MADQVKVEIRKSVMSVLRQHIGNEFLTRSYLDGVEGSAELRPFAYQCIFDDICVDCWFNSSHKTEFHATECIYPHHEGCIENWNKPCGKVLLPLVSITDILGK